MVRLERHCNLYADAIPEFQFHYGAIGTGLAAASSIAANRFQFHYGAIGTKERGEEAEKLTNFNSIMVRLEPIIRILLVVFPIFQFHYGAIGTFF